MLQQQTLHESCQAVSSSQKMCLSPQEGSPPLEHSPQGGGQVPVEWGSRVSTRKREAVLLPQHTKSRTAFPGPFPCLHPPLSTTSAASPPSPRDHPCSIPPGHRELRLTLGTGDCSGHNPSATVLKCPCHRACMPACSVRPYTKQSAQRKASAGQGHRKRHSSVGGLDMALRPGEQIQHRGLGLLVWSSVDAYTTGGMLENGNRFRETKRMGLASCSPHYLRLCSHQHSAADKLGHRGTPLFGDVGLAQPSKMERRWEGDGVSMRGAILPTSFPPRGAVPAQ